MRLVSSVCLSGGPASATSGSSQARVAKNQPAHAFLTCAGSHVVWLELPAMSISFSGHRAGRVWVAEFGGGPEAEGGFWGVLGFDRSWWNLAGAGFGLAPARSAGPAQVLPPPTTTAQRITSYPLVHRNTKTQAQHAHPPPRNTPLSHNHTASPTHPAYPTLYKPRWDRTTTSYSASTNPPPTPSSSQPTRRQHSSITLIATQMTRRVPQSGSRRFQR